MLHAVQPTYITPCCKHTGSICKHHYIIILGLLGDVGTHMGSIGKQVITSSLPDWCWCQAQLVSRSHYCAWCLPECVSTLLGLGPRTGVPCHGSRSSSWHWKGFW